MTSEAYNWNTAVVTGGAGGLGRALAVSLIKKGKKIILAGRTESNLKQTAEEIGAVGYYVLDVSKLSTIRAVVEKIFAEHPEVDCLINNAGVQKPLDFSKPETVKDSDIEEEVNTNITGLVQLTNAFLPYFLKSDKPSCVQNVSSGLAFVPIAPVPVYCATKSFVHSFSVTLRHQLRDTKVKVIEIAPPLVESNLHREHSGDHSQFTKAKNPHALTQEEFIAGVEKGWDANQDEIGVNFSQKGIDAWRSAFGGLFAAMNPK